MTQIVSAIGFVWLFVAVFVGVFALHDMDDLRKAFAVTVLWPFFFLIILIRGAIGAIKDSFKN